MLFSAAWQGNIVVTELPDPGISVRLTRRTIDYDLDDARRLWVYLSDSVRIVREARRYDVTVLSSAGLETFLVPLLRRLLPSRLRGPGALVILDPIMLRWRRLDRVFAFGLRHVDLVLCIRTGDVGMYAQRFDVPPERCRFLAMPVPDVPEEVGEPAATPS